MKLIRRTFQIGFVLSLSLMLVQCSSIIDKIIDELDDDYELVLQAPHTYDITFTRGNETIHYSGSVKEEEPPSYYFKDGAEFYEGTKGYEAIQLNLRDKVAFGAKSDLALNGRLILNKNGILFPLGKDYFDKEINSYIEVSNQSTKYFSSQSGTVKISNLKKLNSSDFYILEDEQIASYTLEFNGEFVLVDSESDENKIYSAKGKVVISPFKKE